MVVPALASGDEPTTVRLETGIVDPYATRNPDAFYARLSVTGATVIRLLLDWRTVAPASLPASFSAADPGDPAYTWKDIDIKVRAAVRHGFHPIIDIAGAPTWATARQVRGGPFKPDPAKLAAFAKAAARRYSGRSEHLPRVWYWQLWNEPNVALNLRPQFVGSTLYSPAWYRRMLNAFADAVHGVDPTNVVIAGGTAPFTTRAGERSSWGPGPLLFLRRMLCLSKNLRPTCKQRAHFDVWAHHPYTSGGPNHHANIADDVSIADLPRMKAVLDAGVQTGQIVPRHKLRFWVTEFSWDTDPPDPNAMPLLLQTRWVSEALYRMSQSGVSLVTWFLLKDQPLASSPYQSGLYFHNGSPKPTLRAFRFPFVAFRNDDGQIDVWGRTPSGKPGILAIEQRSGATWKRLGTVKTNSFGVFTGSYPSPDKGRLRARLTNPPGDLSNPFSLIEPPDRPVRPFGEAGPPGFHN